MCRKDVREPASSYYADSNCTAASTRPALMCRKHTVWHDPSWSVGRGISGSSTTMVRRISGLSTTVDV